MAVACENKAVSPPSGGDDYFSMQGGTGVPPCAPFLLAANSM